MSDLRDSAPEPQNLDPRLRTGEFVFVDGNSPAAGSIDASEIEASVREDEGLSLVLSRAVADREGLGYDFVAGWIEIGLESGLDLVGLTALVSARLAGLDISCNVIAGLRHDHLLVPSERAEQALEALQKPFPLLPFKP